ncbi:MAG TPA: ferritin-like domain-containing protein [Alphaproteobacteria bacterium]|jgi:rubrerythrin
MTTTESTIVTPDRRRFIRGAGIATLSATAIAVLGGRDVLAQGMKGDMSKDVSVLNVALGLEHEAIAAYQIGAESKLLKQPVLGVAVQFQSHHKEHRDALVATIQKLGGKPVGAKSMQEYATALNVKMIKSATDILVLAAKLEKGAANAYLGAIPAFGNGELAKVAGRLAADETMHWTVLAQATKEMLPQKALTFGA